jgi:predicted nuclease of predicted toxin-antitoxin system
VRLLLDQNLSPRLLPALADLFPDSTHVREVGLQYAAQHGFAIVSKDADFHERSFLLGQPPKVIWIRRGNCSTSEISSILRNNYGAVTEFEEDAEASFLALG